MDDTVPVAGHKPQSPGPRRYPEAMDRRIVEISAELNVTSTVRGAKDPVLVGPTELCWVTRTPDGPGSLVMRRVAPDAVEANAWGSGAQWLLQQTPKLLGSDDDLDGFAPTGKILQLWRRHPFLLARSDRLWDAMIGAVLGQKVQVIKARSARRALARRYGVKAPGPRSGWILPAPETVAEFGYYQFHPLGVERKRAETLIRVARAMPRLEAALAGPNPPKPEEVSRQLERIRGVGPWTTAMATAVAFGHRDAVPVGDFHIPNSVAWTMAGEPRGTDERMLELLEPYRGHRWRVVRLAKAAGRPPKYGPRLSLTDDGLTRGR